MNKSISYILVQISFFAFMIFGHMIVSGAPYFIVLGLLFVAVILLSKQHMSNDDFSNMDADVIKRLTNIQLQDTITFHAQQRPKLAKGAQVLCTVHNKKCILLPIE